MPPESQKKASVHSAKKGGDAEQKRRHAAPAGLGSSARVARRIAQHAADAPNESGSRTDAFSLSQT